MPSETQQVTDLITAATTLKTTFEGKDGVINAAITSLDVAKANIVADEVATAASRVNVLADEAAITTSKAGVDADAAAIATAIGDINAAIGLKISHRNLIRHGGRYMDLVDSGTSLRANLPFSADDMLASSYNGSAIAEAGKFIDDNTENGGARGAHTQTTFDLLAKMGRAGDRYGPEFYISQWTAGALTTAGPINGHYLMSGTTSLGMSVYNRISYACWLRVTAGTAWIDNQGSLFIDGVLNVGDKALAVADGWVHVAGIKTNAVGYYTNAMPGMYGVLGTVIEKALPITLPADVQIPIHTQPLL